MSPPTPAELVRDPAWLPYLYNAESDALIFAYAPRETQRRVTFLDPRYLQGVPESEPVEVRDLRHTPVARGRLHFIFHTAFCCSTLLTRAFDAPGISMGLKEPAVLAFFAGVWTQGAQSARALNALGTTLDLLSRPLAPGEAQIVKPSNVANAIVPHMLNQRTSAKAIVMYSSLDEYLRATLRKGAAGAAFNRDLLEKFHRIFPLNRKAPLEALLQSSDLQIAASVWLMQMRLFTQTLRQFGNRIATLDGATLLARPAEVLIRAAQFYGLTAEADYWRSVAAGPVFSEHAKTLGVPFDAGARRTELEQAGAGHEAQIRETITWAEDIAAKADAPLTLGDTLMAG